MADSGGHWLTLAAAAKLTESTKIPGVFETDIKRNNPIDRVAVAQAAHSGKSIKWLREKADTLESAVQDVAVGDPLSWTDSVDYDEVEVELKIKALQRKLNHFVLDIYGTFNDYRAQVMLEMEKGLKRKLGDSIIYDDITYGGIKQTDGMHAQAALQTGTNLDIDNGDTLGLSLTKMRNLEEAMKQGIGEWWIPYPLMKNFGAAYEERGFVGVAFKTTMASIQRGISDVGKQIFFWNGVPFIPTDYLMEETVNVGDGSNLRAKTPGNGNYSIFAVNMGNVMEKQPGMTFAYGGTEGQGDLYKLVPFPNLENEDAEGMRMVTYMAMLFSSKFAIGRIFDVEDTAILV